MGQDNASAPRFKNLEHLIGTWKGEEEIRLSPSAVWEKGKSEWEVRWLPGGYVAQTSGKMRIGGEESSWIQVWGYDPSKDTVVSWYADSTGALGSVTSSGWEGNTFLSNWTDIGPDGFVVVGRCSWEHSSDFKSVTATCDQFTDGTWWTFRKMEGVKSN
jgi:hypothetical protein